MILKYSCIFEMKIVFSHYLRTDWCLFVKLIRDFRQCQQRKLVNFWMVILKIRLQQLID